VSGPVDFHIEFTTEEDLLALYETELKHRRAFVAGSFSIEPRCACRLHLIRANGEQLELAAEAVFVNPNPPYAGVGLELGELSAELLRGFLERPTRERMDGVGKGSAPPVVGQGTNPLERVRQLSLRERDQVARRGPLSERVALERVFGSLVWEALLENPQLTVPEVARIAKNGTLSLPLLTIIVEHGGWLKSGEIRRALLGNPRVKSLHLERILRAAPHSELRQIASVSPYRPLVRSIAKRLLDE
jgi:hypothetical protein